MKLVSSHGGYSIGVYSEKSEDPAKDKAKVYKMMRDNRIRYFAPANYSDGSDLDMLEIASTGNTTEVPKKTFSLQFKAKKKGTTVIRADGDISVTNASGEKFSMWSNQVSS